MSSVYVGTMALTFTVAIFVELVDHGSQLVIVCLLSQFPCGPNRIIKLWSAALEGRRVESKSCNLLGDLPECSEADLVGGFL